MRIVRVSGTPYQRGLSFGIQCRRETRRLLRVMGFFAVRISMPDFRRGRPQLRYHLSTMLQLRHRKEQLMVRVHEMENMLREYWPEVVEEIHGIADGAEVPFDDLLFHNLLGDIYSGCSVWAAAGDASRDGNPLLAMNTDEEKIVAPFEVIKIIEPHEGPKVIGTTMIGWAQLNSGMNANGLAMAFPLLWLKRDDLPGSGMPAIALNRPLYECQTVDEALRMLVKLPPVVSPVAQYVVDRQAAARIEWARQEREFTVVENGVLSNTNRPETDRFKKLDATLQWSPSVTVNAVPRQKRMAQLLAQHRGNIDSQIMMDIASDHGQDETKGKSMCQHSVTPAGVATVTSMVADPRAGRVWVAGCTPCKTGFKEFNLLLEEPGSP